MITKTVSFTENEYKRLQEKGVELGYSESELIEYAVMLYVDMPRKNILTVANIKQTLMDYINSIQKGDTFICATPFGSEWVQMSTSQKRIASAQLKILERKNIVRKQLSATKHHNASLYEKL